MSIRFECFGMTILKAVAFDLSDPRDPDSWRDPKHGVLNLYLPNDGKISLFMLYEAAEAYASAINTVNDREATEAPVLTGVDGGDVG